MMARPASGTHSAQAASVTSHSKRHPCRTALNPWSLYVRGKETFDGSRSGLVTSRCRALGHLDGKFVLRILLVENDARLGAELCSALEERAPVQVVGSARAQDEACAWIDGRTQGCDIALIDVFLKRGTGLGVLEHIAKYEQPLRRVVLTNYATRDMHQRSRELGADAVFDKSTEIEELVDWLAGAQVRH